MWTGINKRKFPRYNIAIELNIAIDRKIRYIASHTENLGVGGLCFLFDKHIDPFHEISLKLPIDDGKLPIECNGRVTWAVEKHTLGATEKQFDIGVEFLDLSSEDRRRIEKLLQQHER